MAEPESVFISYAHADAPWLTTLRDHLSPWIRARHLCVWSDQNIPVGAHWDEEIGRAMAQARVAVLLVTKAFLASDFIMERELPVLLERHKRGEVRIVPISVGHAALAPTPLKDIQFANDPAQPLEALDTVEVDRILVGIGQTISDALTLSNLAFGLGVMDQTTEPMEARLEGRAEEPNRAHSVTAHLAASDQEIRFEGAQTRITYDDLSALSEDDRAFIADLERTMRGYYEERQSAKDKLGSEGGHNDAAHRAEMARLEKLMCNDLGSILDFLSKMLQYELEDHYSRYRYICGQL